ncbi:glycosyltransferase [Pseudomonas sp. RGM2987]|uniref:glycosyltransferase n=1 Tax=Pseudomonas sp. RGM2987 TaxID=2930090 RepID=UPI001FD6A066|nr:glycosyltransferase [Pseudomonas sp. RGM2987]MCJ8205239.1 glycosyltransferase [Pseudomonas sp. RGM2987]
MAEDRSLIKPKIDILLVIEGEIATTHLIEHMLSACEPYGIVYRKVFLAALKPSDIRKTTIPFFVRSGDPSLRLWIERLHNAHHPYIYYIDDNFWKIEGDSPIALYYQHPLIRHTLETAISGAYRVLTNSDLLAEFLYQFNEKIEILPSFFDFSLLKAAQPPTHGELRIGFAGSPSRVDDLEIIKPVIRPILDAYPQVVFEFIGATPSDLGSDSRIRTFPHNADYEGFIHFKQERQWSIGLAPLIDNYSNRCKTNNKYREYSACGIAGIYSNMPPYQRSVVDGETGLLTEHTTQAWISAISQLISDPTLRARIASNAYEDVLEKHSVERVAMIWSNHFAQVQRHMKRTRIKPLRINKLKSYLLAHFLRFESLWVRASTVYAEGGWRLVAEKLVNRIKFALLRDKAL